MRCGWMSPSTTCPYCWPTSADSSDFSRASPSWLVSRYWSSSPTCSTLYDIGWWQTSGGGPRSFLLVGLLESWPSLLLVRAYERPRPTGQGQGNFKWACRFWNTTVRFASTFFNFQKPWLTCWLRLYRNSES